MPSYAGAMSGAPVLTDAFAWLDCAVVERHAADVRVLHTGGRWFGLTHREDRSSARERIAELIRRGDYPERLWD